MSATHHAHPGEILLEEFLKPMGVSQYRLAKDIGVDPARINAIVHGKRGITPATAVRLSRYFSMSERFWINAQAHYDLEIEKALHAEEINAIRPVQARVRGLSLGPTSTR